VRPFPCSRARKVSGTDSGVSSRRSWSCRPAGRRWSSLDSKIEATHAGDAGRAFSGVADEVGAFAKTANTPSAAIRAQINWISAGLVTTYQHIKQVAMIDASAGNYDANS
jgi:hypothetical protein